MAEEKNWQFELEQYIKQGEPNQVEKSEAWQAAIGLQAVDGLQTSGYLLDTAVEMVSSQSVISKVPKCQFGTLECTLEELAILELILENPSIKQNELVKVTGKSLRSIKRIMESLQEKQYIRRVDEKRYGKWEVLVRN